MKWTDLNSTFAWVPAVVSDRRLRIAIALLIVLTGVGTVGYQQIEGLSAAEALYMTVITLSTVGFGEVVPLSNAGRWFTIGLIVTGVGAVLHAAGALAVFVIEGRLREVLGRRSMQRTIDLLENHVIVCGFGRLGRAVCERLHARDIITIDTDESVQKAAEEAGHLFVHGSALEEGVLRLAGIERARALIATTSSDPDNVFIALSARELSPTIQIHGSADSPAGVRRLRLAGASQVISPHQLAGQRIANALLRPGVVEFLELSDPGTSAEVDLEEVELSESSVAEGLALRDLQEHGVTLSVIAIKRGDDPIRMHPSPDFILCGGDRVVAVGDRANLMRLSTAAQPE